MKKMVKKIPVATPLVRYLTLVLTNGASIKIPTVVEKTRPLFANFDVFNHAKWEHNIKTEATLEAERNFLPDFNQFYTKFGGSGATASQSRDTGMKIDPRAVAQAQAGVAKEASKAGGKASSQQQKGEKQKKK